VTELMPCSFSVTGNLFLIAVLGTILAFSAKTIADGSDLLLEVLHPGVIGGFVIPLLGALPDALIILVSGIGDEVEDEISVGMGTLCGSTIMLLTIAWSGGLLAGRTDIINHKSVDKQLNHKWNIIKTGVTTIPDIRANAIIMVVTLLPYFIIMIISLIDFPRTIDPVEKEDMEDEYVMASFIFTFVFFVVYSIYMVFNTTVQENRIRAARRRLVMDMVAQLFVQSIRESHQAELIEGMEDVMATSSRSPHRLHFSEDDPLTKGLLQAANHPEDDNSVNIALITDQMVNGGNFNELYNLARKWKRRAQHTVNYSILAKEKAEAAVAGIEDQDEAKAKMNSEIENSMASLQSLGSEAATLALQEGQKKDDGDDDDEGDSKESGKQGKVKIILKACVLLALGAGGAAVFSDPMVDAIVNMSVVAGIPKFFISFVVTPFASNASELIASLYFCAKRTSQSVSVAMAAVYGAVTMNSTLNLGILLLLMWRQDIYWKFTAEAIPMILIVFAVGICASVKNTFLTLEGLIVFALYPISIGLTYGLQCAGLDDFHFPNSSSASSKTSF